MKRRTFIKTTSLSLPVLLNGFRLSAMPMSSLFSAFNLDNDRILVLINLIGGNDGLNTIIPLDQYDKLANVRSNIILPQSALLDVGFDNAFHPAMTGLKDVFDNGKMSVVQSVGYPNQNRSHFRSTDIWNSASPANEVWTTGWLGRYFQQEYPDYPTGYPNADYPDPFAITIGSLVSETCQGTVTNFSMAINDPFNINPLANPGNDPLPDTPYGDELAFLRTSFQQTNAYSDAIEAAASAGANVVDYPADSSLAQALKNVALLITGGLKTRVYVVSIGGFDTHANQVVSGEPTNGTHAQLLSQLSTAVNLFLQDIEQQGHDKRVLCMTYSEFGRRIRSNESLGTDHGDAAPLMLFGSCVAPGFIGDNPEIPENPEVQDAVAMQYDFRNVYGSVLEDWFQVPADAVRALLFEDYQHIPLIQGCETTATTETLPPLEVEAFPNPFSRHFRVRFSCVNERARLSVFNGFGQQIYVAFDKRLPAGTHEFFIDAQDWPAGTYYVHLQLENGRQKTRLMVKSR